MKKIKLPWNSILKVDWKDPKDNYLTSKLVMKVREQIGKSVKNDEKRTNKSLNSLKDEVYIFYQYSRDQLYIKPFYDVSLEDRKRFVVACIIKCFTELSLGELGNNREREDPKKVLEDNDFRLKSNLVKLLDETIIIAGAPILRDIIDETSSLLHSELLNLNPINLNHDNSTLLNNKSSEELEFPSFSQSITENSKDQTDFLWFSQYINRENTKQDIQPFVIRKFSSDWNAVDSKSKFCWNDLTYLMNQIGPYRTVPVEIGSQYTDQNWQQKLMTFQDFLNSHILSCHPSAGDDTEEHHNDNQKKKKTHNPTGYLAQYDLFHQFPILLKDIDIPDFCYCKPNQDESVTVNSWVGPENTISPFHEDPKDNCFVQVVGYKYFCLVQDKNRLVLYDSGSLMSNTSQTVPDQVPKESKWETIVGPGDLLFIPVE